MQVAAYLGEIRVFAFDQVPQGWLPCDGRSLEVQPHQALYSLLGDTFGSAKPKHFNLPDLRGRTPMGSGQNPIGSYGGTEAVQLAHAEMPAHNHPFAASTKPAETRSPAGNFLSSGPTADHLQFLVPPFYHSLNRAAIGDSGGDHAHPNMQPFTVSCFCIAVEGDF